MAARGKFITFEGGEGAGKSTQARKLKAALELRGHTVVLTREPGGSLGAEEIRKLLVHGEKERWSVLAETLLLFAARSDHVTATINPSLKAGEWVICDRFTDSTYAYQGTARGLDMEIIRQLENITLGDLKPDLTLVIDVPVEIGLARTAGRATPLYDSQFSNLQLDEAKTSQRRVREARFERFGREFHRNLREAFNHIAREEPDRCVVIDGVSDSDTVSAAVWRAVQERLHP